MTDEKNTKHTDDLLDITQPEDSDQEQSTLGKVGLFFLEFIKVALLAGLTIGLVRYFLFKPFYVKGQSMVPTFYEREYLIVDEITYRFREPERGEVIVFRAPIDEKDFYLKRVIGLPGERVRVDDNKIVIYNEKYPEGVVVEESYLPISKKTSGSVIFTLGADEYFVLGDNREASFDSRRFGPIPRSDIIGRTVFRGWPFSRISTFSTPEYNF
ncbi:MAG TPA: signal peptidase I [Candidatus Magasanikbacteria bacterium]|nr:signal peptidase I [Candidatus Magasanikbacteria bacterium]